VARRRAGQARQRFQRVEDFYAYLRQRLHVQPLTPENTARAAQLAVKTNQFNTTLARPSRAELEARAAAGGGVYVLGLEDRFTERENIGLLVVDWPERRGGAAEIALFLLSCRVLGRGVERAALGWLARAAARRGAGALRGAIVEGPRNEPVRRVYADAGFAAAGPGLWTLDPRATDLAPPDWIALEDTTESTADAA
jgi:FkbH-like protein